MCGITAYLGVDSSSSRSSDGSGCSNGCKAHKMVLEGISILQNRGYDSAGIATIGEDLNGGGVALRCNKWAGADSLERLAASEEDHEGHNLAIAHTRWATHGGISDQNAHPHLDWKDRVAVVHNGIIENYTELKNFLIGKGITFRSETDTEVIANTIGYFLDQDASTDLESAIVLALERLEGTWGLAIIGKGASETLFLAKNGSPLLLGWTDDFALVASQSSALSRHCKQHIVVEDGAMLTISIKDEKICIHKNRKLVHNPEADLNIMRSSNGEEILLRPDPYQYWMQKEIVEQPESLQRTLNMGGRIKDEYEVRLGGLEGHCTDLLEIEHLILLGCGTSLNAARVGTLYFKRLEIFKTVQVIDASEFDLVDLPNTEHGKIGLLVLSQSGETKDVHRAMELVKEKGIKIFSIVNVPGTLIAREAMCGVYLNAGREVGVASTKSFTSQVLALALIAVWFSQKRGTHKPNRAEILRSIHSLSLGVKESLEGLYGDGPESHLIEKIARTLIGGEKNSIFILGRGACRYIADEAALKLKEIGYVHAEGYAGGALKHGPFALIEKGTPIFIIAPDDANFPKMRIAAEEVHARGADVFLITDRPVEKLDSKEREIYNTVIHVPTGNKYFVGLYSILPFQLLCYKMALLLGHNPDKPRNLAKVVTVDG